MAKAAIASQRAGGRGLLVSRKVFQRLIAEGVALRRAIRDAAVTIA